MTWSNARKCIRLTPFRPARPAAGMWTFVVGVSVFLAQCSIGNAQGKAVRPGEVQPVQLTAQDGHPIHLSYYKSTEGQDAPVVILLHMKGGNRLVWEQSFAKILQQQGYAVLAVDLRKHGQSKADGGAGTSSRSGSERLTAHDYKAMTLLDMHAIKDFLFEEHQKKNLNMRKTAIVAPEMSAPIAINFAMLDWQERPYDDAPTLASRTPRGQIVQALVLISPDANLPGVTAGKALNFLREPALGIAFLFAVGQQDPFDRNQTERLYKQVSGIKQNEARTFFQPYPTKLRGTDLLGKQLRIEEHMLVFLDKFLKKRNLPWEDRRPRYQRTDD